MIHVLINNINKIIRQLKTDKPKSLGEWRKWSENAVFIVVLVILPVGIIFSLPIYLAENRYGLIALNLIIMTILIIRLIDKWGSYYFWIITWLILIYIAMMTFYITLGPHYARSAWLVFFSVMTALFLGTTAGACAVLINMIMLLGLYFFLGPENTAWTLVYQDPFFKYLMFVINSTFVALVPTLMVGFMLSRLDQTHGFQQQMMQELQEKNESMKSAEKTIKESEIRYRVLFESAGDAIVVAKDGSFTECNRKALEIFGCGRDDIIGSSPGNFSPPTQPDGRNSDVKAMEKIRIALEKNSQIFEWQHKKLDGTLFFAEVSLTRIHLSTEDSILAIVRDITNRKKTEEVMVQSEKMLSVGGLAAGMAHEINNPLAGMMQTAGVMSRRLIDIEMPANQKVAQNIGVKMDDIKAFMEKRDILRMIKTIEESGQRVAQIVENMLGFARKTESSVSSHNLAELCDKILELAATDYDLKKQYDFKSIKIIKEYEDNLPMVPCEGPKIQQVLLNILGNGAQAMHEVMVKNNKYKPIFIVRLFRETKANILTIEIEDNGPGMDEEIRKRIFEPFFTTKPPGVGTGLGLSVSYFIITENHGGEMTVESYPGLGTKFIICLPLDDS